MGTFNIYGGTVTESHPTLQLQNGNTRDRSCMFYESFWPGEHSFGFLYLEVQSKSFFFVVTQSLVDYFRLSFLGLKKKKVGEKKTENPFCSSF